MYGGTCQNEHEVMVVVVGRVWIHTVIGLDVVVRGRRGARKGLQWDSVPEINITQVGHEGISGILQIRFCA